MSAPMSHLFPALRAFVAMVVAPLAVLALMLHLIGFNASLKRGSRRLFAKKRRDDVFVCSARGGRGRTGSGDSLDGDGGGGNSGAAGTSAVPDKGSSALVDTGHASSPSRHTYLPYPSSGPGSAYSSAAERSRQSSASFRRSLADYELEVVLLSTDEYDVRRADYGDETLSRSFDAEDSPCCSYGRDAEEEGEEGRMAGGEASQGGGAACTPPYTVGYAEGGGGGYEEDEEEEEDGGDEDLRSHFHKYMYGSPCLQLAPAPRQHSPLDDALHDSRKRFAALQRREGEREQKIQQEVARSRDMVHADMQKKQALLVKWEAEDRVAKEAAEAARVATIRGLEALVLGSSPLLLRLFADLVEEVRASAPQEVALLRQAAALQDKAGELREKVEGYCDELAQDSANRSAAAALLSLAADPLFRRLQEGGEDAFVAAGKLAGDLGSTQPAEGPSAAATSDALSALESQAEAQCLPADVQAALQEAQDALAALTASVAEVASPTRAMFKLCDICLGIKTFVLKVLKTNDIGVINKILILLAHTYANSVKSCVDTPDDVAVMAFAASSIFRSLNANNAKHFGAILRCALARVCRAVSPIPRAYSYSDEGLDSDGGAAATVKDACVVRVLAFLASSGEGAARPPFARADAWKWLVRYGKVLSCTLGSLDASDKAAGCCARDCCVILEGFLQHIGLCFMTYYEDKFVAVLGAIEKTVNAAKPRAPPLAAAAMEKLLAAVSAARAEAGRAPTLFRGTLPWHAVYARFVVAAEEASRDNFQRLDKDPAFRAQRGYKESKMVRGDLSKALAEDIVGSLSAKFVLTKSVSADMLTVTVFRAVDEIIEKFQVPQNDERRAHPLAPVVVKLSEASPVFRELFRSQFYKVCPWCVPVLQWADSSLGEDEEMHLMGRWRDGSGTFESDDKYEARMLKLLSAFASICLLTPGGEGGGAPFGQHDAWAWLANLTNASSAASAAAPLHEYTAKALEVFLHIAGQTLSARLGGRFAKLLRSLEAHVVRRLLDCNERARNREKERLVVVIKKLL